MRVVHQSSKFKVLSHRNNFIVVKINNTFYNQHSHFTTYHSAVEFVNLMEKGIMPHSEYFIVAAKRLLTEEEFNKLTKLGNKEDII